MLLFFCGFFSLHIVKVKIRVKSSIQGGPLELGRVVDRVVEGAEMLVLLLVVTGEHVHVVDLDVLEVTVGHEEGVLIDLAVEGIAEGLAVHEAGAGANARGVGVVEVGELLVLLGEGRDEEVELHGEALLPALGQDQAVGEGVVGLADVQGSRTCPRRPA